MRPVAWTQWKAPEHCSLWTRQEEPVELSDVALFLTWVTSLKIGNHFFGGGAGDASGLASFDGAGGLRPASVEDPLLVIQSVRNVVGGVVGRLGAGFGCFAPIGLTPVQFEKGCLSCLYLLFG